MKKCIYVLICFGLLMTSIPCLDLSVQAAESAVDSSDVNFVTLLNSFGILDSINTEDIEAILTRGEFISLCARLVNAELDSRSPAVFSDVSVDSQYAAPVYYAYVSGWISKDSEFYPENPITMAQAVKILVAITGFNAHALNRGGYPSGYMSVGYRNNILKGIGANMNSAVSLGIAAKMLVNLFEAPFAEAEQIGGDDITFSYGDNTVFSIYHKLYKAEGVVQAYKNARASLFAEELGMGYIQIDDNIFKMGDVEYRNTLGKTVDYVYRIEEAGDVPEIIYLRSSQKNRALEIDYGSVVELSGDFRLSYEEDDGYRLRNVKLSSITNVIYNNIYIGKLLNISHNLLKDALGGISLIDNNEDGIWEYLFIDHYDTYYVNNVSGDRGYFDSFYPGFAPVDLSGIPEADYPDIVKDGAPFSIENIRQYHVAMVRRDYLSGRITQIEISNEEVNGILDMTEIKSNGGMLFYINDMSYVLHPLFEAAAGSVKIGSEHSFVLDNKNRIVGVKKRVAANAYGYIIKLSMVQGELGIPRLAVRLLDYEGNIATYKFAEKFNVDSTQIVSDSEAEIDRAIQLLSNTGAHEDYIGGFLESESSLAPSNVAIKKGYHQVVAFKRNEEGLITDIDTIAPDENNIMKKDFIPSFNSSSTSAIRYISASSMFCDMNSNNRAIIGAETLIFFVPLNGKKMEDGYFFAQKSNLTGSAYYTLHAYNIDEDTAVADVIVIEDGTPKNSGQPLLDSVGKRREFISISTDGLKYSIITKVVRALDELGDETTKVYILKDRTSQYFYVKEDTYIYSHKEYWDSGRNTALPPKPDSYLKPGQVITYTENASTKAARIVAVLNDFPDIEPVLSDYFIVNPSAYEESAFGRLVSRSGTTIKIETNYGGNGAVFAFNATGSPQIYKFNARSKLVELFDYGSISSSVSRYAYIRSRMGRVPIIVLYDY